MKQKTTHWLILIAYVLCLCFFAFRPFQPIPGKRYPSVEKGLNVSGESIYLKTGVAAEFSKKDALKIRSACMASDRISIELKIKTDSLNQNGPARIITYSREAMSRNFMVGQDGTGLTFRLRTTETDGNGCYPSLVVPLVFEEGRIQHLIVTFDGKKTRLYVDGKQHPKNLELGGSFDNWGINHILVLGDEPPGGRPWEGKIFSYAVYDRALTDAEAVKRFNGEPVGSAVVSTDFQSLKPLRYRNIFVSKDSAAFTAIDAFANIVAFIPLAGLLWMVFPVEIRRRKVEPVAFPLLMGGCLSVLFELVQFGIANRVPCALDLFYNTFGTLLGCLLMNVVFKMKES